MSYQATMQKAERAASRPQNNLSARSLTLGQLTRGAHSVQGGDGDIVMMHDQSTNTYRNIKAVSKIEGIVVLEVSP